MSAFSYVVRIELPARGPMLAFLGWLRDVHVADVCAAGAEAAEVVVLDGTEHVLEARYHFASREAFERYEREHAPRLRADGRRTLERLGLAPEAVRFTRTTGEVAVRR